MAANLIYSPEIVEEQREPDSSSIDFRHEKISYLLQGFRLLLLKVIADGGAANMSQSGFKLDPSFVYALKDPYKQNYEVAKSAREKRRKIIADKRAKRRRAYESNVVSSVKEPMVTQLARERRRQIILAKKALRCTNSNTVISNYEAREAPGQNSQVDNPLRNTKKE